MRGGASPSLPQILLLRAALGQGAGTGAAFRAWSEVVDLERLDVESTRLLPLLAANLVTAGVEHPWMERLKGVHRSSWYRNQILLGRLVDVVEDLSYATVPSILSMGAALAPLYYPDIGARPLHDAVVVVSQHGAVAAAERLVARGWTPLDHGFDDLTPPLLLARDGALFDGGGGLRIELRWRRLDRQLRRGEEELWAEHERVRIEGRDAVFVSGAAPLLLEICATAGTPGATPAAAWAADVAMILKRQTLDWARVVDLARSYRLERALAERLSWVARHLDEPAAAVPLAELGSASPRRRVLRRFEPSGGVVAGAVLRAARHVRGWALLRRRDPAYEGIGGGVLYLRQAFALRRTGEIPRHVWRSLRWRFSRTGAARPPSRDDGARASAPPPATDRGPR